MVFVEFIQLASKNLEYILNVAGILLKFELQISFLLFDYEYIREYVLRTYTVKFIFVYFVVVGEYTFM